MVARNVLPTRTLLKMKGGITTYQYYTQNKKYCLERVFDVDPFLTDGHPSFTPDGRYMITDTYPDKYHCQRLYVYDLQTSKYLLLGAFNAYYDKNPASCAESTTTVIPSRLNFGCKSHDAGFLS